MIDASPGFLNEDPNGLELKDNRQKFNLEDAATQRKAAWPLKAGTGRTSGLGEFWNLELAQKSLLLPKGVEAAEEMRRRGGKSDWALSSVEASERAEDELSSSMERLKTPSLGERTCCGLRSKVGEDVGLGWNGKLKKVLVNGAVWGPSS